MQVSSVPARLAIAAGLAAAALAAPRAAHAATDNLPLTVGVEVEPTNAFGHAWDRGKTTAAPDVEIEIRIDGKKVRTCPVVQDALRADCAVPDTGGLPGDLDIALVVLDKDVIADDTIGHARGTLPAGSVGRVPLHVDGQVARAWIEAAPVPAPRFHRPFALGLGAVAGVLVALGLLATFRRRFLTPGHGHRAAGPLAPAVTPAEPRVRFWRSPVLLGGSLAAIVGILIADAVSGPHVAPLFAAIPMALGAFAVTGAIIDAFAHEALGATRARVGLAGLAAIASVPTLRAVGGASGLAHLIGAAFVIALILWCLNDWL